MWKKICCLLLFFAIVVAADSPPEAPTGFDGLTNGSIDQAAMSAALDQFSEQEGVDDGVGPTYNDVSCVNCHQSPAAGGATQSMELRAGHGDTTGRSGPRRRSRFDTNGSSGSFAAANAVLTNGVVVENRSLINQRAICPEAEEHVVAPDNVSARRMSISLFGDGFVEAVPDAALLALAQKNGGEAIMVDVAEQPGTQAVGRFGWKDQQASLLSFSGDAYVNEMGVTNELFPDEATTVCNPDGIAEPNNVGDVNLFAAFMRALKAPPRGAITPDVVAGQAVFEQTGCASCHVETLETAPVGAALFGGAYVVPSGVGGVQFHPFGDYLLHDVGTGDGIVQNGPDDTQYKVRTAPLWGLRARTMLLHDGSAVTVSDAVTRHGGEAAAATRAYHKLSGAQRAQLLAFLNSL